jgi:hypothetical protein
LTFLHFDRAASLVAIQMARPQSAFASGSVTAPSVLITAGAQLDKGSAWRDRRTRAQSLSGAALILRNQTPEPVSEIKLRSLSQW